ncbi:MAG: hypothetical protein ACTS2F_20250 [Thainema sp.]
MERSPEMLKRTNFFDSFDNDYHSNLSYYRRGSTFICQLPQHLCFKKWVAIPAVGEVAATQRVGANPSSVP